MGGGKKMLTCLRAGGGMKPGVSSKCGSLNIGVKPLNPTNGARDNTCTHTNSVVLHLKQDASPGIAETNKVTLITSNIICRI